MFTMVTYKVTIVNIERLAYSFDMAVKYHHGDLKKAALDQAIKLIQERNEATFTIRELADKLGVSHTALYRHFDSKQAVLVAVALAGFQRLSSMFDKSSNTNAVRAKFQKLGQSYIEFALNNPGYYRAMFHNELRCYEVEMSTQLSELHQAGEKTFQALVNILTAGMKSKDFKKNDPVVVARSVWSAMHGFCILILDGQFQNLNSKSKNLKQAIKDHLRFIESSVKNY